jgi:ketosteroid isomerase-like protein
LRAVEGIYAIEIAKTEFREGFNTGDVERVLAVFAPAFIDMSAGQPGFYGPEARNQLERRLKELFAVYKVRMFMMVAEINVVGDFATDWGWHKFWLTPKEGGETQFLRLRYSEQWVKQNGEWKIAFLFTAADLQPQMIAANEATVLHGIAATFAT